MVELAGGEFLMGTDDEAGFPADGEGPVRRVSLRPFYIDETAVTNAQFSRFMKATRYKTEAEQFDWSFVFHLFLTKRARRVATQAVAEVPWWLPVTGATWRHPEGPGSDVKDRMDHPAVHVSWNDALSYAEWAGKRLSTEAEWEFAARGGLEQKRYAWGDDLTPGGEHLCNIWQGDFPDRDTAADGYSGTAPARSYAPNGHGLYNVSGNVWEWTADWFSADYHVDGRRDDPQGPPEGASRVTRGGSYLCHDSYCNRYRVAARSSSTPDSSTGNLGFRCALDA
jgi:formylglycine-generating enzyme required for sulfatase activity